MPSKDAATGPDGRDSAMIERQVELVIELGEPVLDGIDAEARGAGQAWKRRTDAAEDIRRKALEDAAHVLGKTFMGRLFDGWPLTHPPMPESPSTEFTIDRKRAPVKAIESATPKRRRVRKAKGDAA
jgi:hypothetical protein